MRYRRLLATLTFVLSFVAAAASADNLRIALGGEPLTLDPHRYNLRLEETVLTDLFEGLTAHDEHGRIVPGVAESWNTSADGLTWTFKLRPDARWSDGRPLGAEDFVFSLRRLLDPQTAASLAFFLYPIENAVDVNAGNAPVESLGVRALDATTLEIKLAKPFPFLAERLIYPTGFPVPRHAIAAHGDEWSKAGNMVGNGAFTLESWRPQEAIDLTKNAAFRDADTVRLAGVTYVPIADSSVAYNRYLAGEIDIIGDFPPGEVEELRRERPEEIHLSPLLSIMYLVFNVEEPPFDDPRVREALALAIDRDILTSRVLESGEVPSSALAPALVGDYEPDLDAAGIDIDRAKSLLADAGYADRPLEITLRHIATAESKRVQVAISAMWRRIGVQTRLHQSDINVHFATLRQGDFQVAQAGWFGENNPEHYIELLASDIGDVNYGRFKSAAFDAILSKARTTPDKAERIETLIEAQRTGLAEFPLVPLYSVVIRSLVRPDIRGWHTNPRNVHGSRYLRVGSGR